MKCFCGAHLRARWDWKRGTAMDNIALNLITVPMETFKLGKEGGSHVTVGAMQTWEDSFEKVCYIHSNAGQACFIT